MTISEYIEQDLESRIQSGDDLPLRLTLGQIAKMYDVSATPVRAALDGLLARGLLTKRENGRLQIPGSKRRKKGAARPAPPVDWDAVLGREIILLSLVDPSDPFVREEAMAEKHGIGRTQLRSAFQRLAGGGLLEHVPRRGWRVPSFQKDEMEAYLDIRETLEVKALDLGRARLDSAELERMMAGNSPSAVGRGAIDNTLHSYFIQASGNRYIEAFFDANGRYYNALFDYAGLGAKVVAEMAGQHLEILEHARAKRWAKARASLSHHIQSQRPVMEAMIATVRAQR